MNTFLTIGKIGGKAIPVLRNNAATKSKGKKRTLQSLAGKKITR